MSWTLFSAFLLACVLISITPGAGAINTMSNGMTYGVRRTLPSILGLQIGLAFQILVVGIGLGSLLAGSSLAFSIIKWAGVAYLVYLGVSKWRERAVAIRSDAANIRVSAGRRCLQSALVNATNPKATIFLVALLPQFVVADAPHGPQFMAMGMAMIGIDVIVMIGFATLSTLIARWLQTPRQQRAINRVFGGLFVGAAGLLAAYRHA
ncbi:homoserine/homoserine lactone efflux protein [Larsenimonas rhizosphaerae]|uniref:Homoserine/homoserine lactone efflux protein n=1 Tax=Larsenimonas rhizosphaerae TaxID=2944682 RepID=A0AA42CT54_9GAMM|nr:homoserine/homoserine lactone efflux protein [Larsenimonas rhizosphaerae]MCM2130127.1 homoserine/homoserine lactone efflux protein [Larsenimonas rhizosphaerae]MCX2522814.1 homoserine/homoserine lactone efflux protein [Larsenimonas rhizosphaerae]